MIEPHDIDALVVRAKAYAAERKRFAKISARRQGENTQKQNQKLEAELNWSAMELAKLEKNLHVACVDADLADLREPHHYAEQEFRPSGWHTYRWTCNQPKAMGS